MKIQIKTILQNITKRISLITIYSLVFFPVFSYASIPPLNTGEEDKTTTEIKKEANFNKHVSVIKYSEASISDDNDSTAFTGRLPYEIAYAGKENTIMVKVVRKEIGDLIHYTAYPIKWINNMKQKNSHLKKNNRLEDNYSQEKSDELELFFDAGFVDDNSLMKERINNKFPEQFISLSGHFNNFCLMFIIVLGA